MSLIAKHKKRQAPCVDDGRTTNAFRNKSTNREAAVEHAHINFSKRGFLQYVNTPSYSSREAFCPQKKNKTIPLSYHSSLEAGEREAANATDNGQHKEQREREERLECHPGKRVLRKHVNQSHACTSGERIAGGGDGRQSYLSGLRFA